MILKGVNKRYVYHKGFKVYNRYKEEANHIQSIYIKSIKNFIDNNIIKLNKKINKKKICYTESMVYNTEVLNIENHF